VQVFLRQRKRGPLKLVRWSESIPVPRSFKRNARFIQLILRDLRFFRKRQSLGLSAFLPALGRRGNGLLIVGRFLIGEPLQEKRLPTLG
jgi:hypothetical protein